MTAKTPSRKTGLRQKAQLMSASEIERTMVRLAYEIVEKNGGVAGLGLVGIRRRGVPIAERLGKIITRIENAQVPVGTLDITFYRDDLSTLGPKPVVQEKEIGFEIEDKNIVSGRRRSLYRSYDASGIGCPLLTRQATARAIVRTGRSRASRNSSRGDLRWTARTDHDERSDRSEADRDRRCGKSSADGTVTKPSSRKTRTADFSTVLFFLPRQASPSQSKRFACRPLWFACRG